MQSKPSYILEGSLTRGVISLATPVIFSTFFSSLLHIVNTFWLGKISAETVAAVSAAWPIVFIVFTIAAGLSVGCNALVARFVGSQDLPQASVVAKNSLLLTAVVAVFLVVVGLIFSQALFGFLGVSGEVLHLALIYTQVFFYGTPVTALTFTLGSILRGEGDTKTPMKILIAINILNLVLDPIFIFIFGWGVAGAAWATFLSSVVALLLYLAYFWQGRSLVPLAFNKLQYNQKFINEIFFIGFPASLRNVTNAIGVFFTIKIIAVYGSAVIAAYGIAFRVELLGFFVAEAIAIATVTLVSQNLGANNLKRAKMSGWVSTVLSGAMMTILGVVVWILAEPIIRIFNTEPEVVLYGVQILKIKAPAFLLSAFLMTLSAAFAAFGKAHYGLATTILRVVLMIGMAYWFNVVWGLVGVWWAVVVSGFISTLANVIWYHLYQPKPALNNPQILL